MSAAEKLKVLERRAVLRGLRIPTPDYMNVAGDLIGALPQIVAVVEAAEKRERLLYRLANAPREKIPHPLELDDQRREMTVALSALDEVLSQLRG